jgi:hypothetical protein
MQNFIFITRDYHILPVADRLKDDGRTVIVGMVEDEKNPPSNIPRWELYDGIMDKADADDVIEWMGKIDDKDEWFVMLDYNDLWEYTEKILKMGFKVGAFPDEEDHEIEQNREKGKEFVRKHYPDLHVAEVHEFKRIEEAIKFIESQQGKIFVLKSEGSDAETVVPETTDADLGKLQIVGALQTEKKDYEKGGFTLEEKIQNPIELSPVMCFWNGKPLFSLCELENKNLGSGNIGRLTGGCQNITLQTPFNCALNKIAFPPIVYEQAKKKPGLSIFDAGLLYDGKRFCFGEFAGNRFGFDGFYSTVAMCGDEHGHGNATRFFDLVSQGQNPLRHKYGVSVRLFQTQPGDDPDTYQAGYFIDWLNEISDQLFLYCIQGKKLENGKMGFVSNGFEKEIGVCTGTGDVMIDAINNAYRCAAGIAMTGLYYRPRFDFLSKDYFTSIMNRDEFLQRTGLLE